MLDEDLEVIVTEGILRTPDIFRLEYLHVISGTTVLPMASVELSINGRSVRGAGYGNGPIDSAFKHHRQVERHGFGAFAVFR